jgi:predicted Zn-dependent peptidase
MLRRLVPPPSSLAALPSFDVERHRLDNGLEVLLHVDRRLPLVAIDLWYHVGSRDERPGRTGLAHLFEHMLFQGSAHVGVNDHFRLVQQVGGVANGSTWYDRTNYYETLPAHALELGLWLESDRMGFLLEALTDEKLETQRSVVRNERRQRVDNAPYGRAPEALFARLYPGAHPYGWPVIGTDADIQAATRADVEGFFRTHYRPGNAVLALVGDFDPTHALALVERAFGTLPGGPAPTRPSLPARDGGGADAGHGSSEPSILADRVGLERVYLGYEVPSILDRDWNRLAVFTEALAGGKSSPLQQRLVFDLELAQDVSAYLYPTELAATWLLVATARPGVSGERLEAELIERLAIAGGGDLEDGDTDRARRRLLAGALADFETVDRKAEQMCQGATYFGDPRRALLDMATVAEIGTEEATRCAARWLAPERRVSVRVVPEGAA